MNFTVDIDSPSCGMNERGWKLESPMQAQLRSGSRVISRGHTNIGVSVGSESDKRTGTETRTLPSAWMKKVKEG